MLFRPKQSYDYVGDCLPFYGTRRRKNKSAARNDMLFVRQIILRHRNHATQATEIHRIDCGRWHNH
jgi:hypothetical protein